MTFDWMIGQAPNRNLSAKQRRAMYRTELSERASLLCRLNYSENAVLARLSANVDWDFEVGANRPTDLSDEEISRIVKASFARR